jgi:hypothetical protein
LDEVASDVRKLTREARRFRLTELLIRLNELAVSRYAEKAVADHANIEAQLREHNLEMRMNVDRSEWLVHESEGTTNDLVFAIARTVSHLAANHLQGAIVSNDNAAADDLLVRLIFEASRTNALEFLVDMVSYGEWYVEEVALGEKPVVRFNIQDARLTKARILGVRRNVISARFGQREGDFRAAALADLLRQLMKDVVRSHSGIAQNVVLSGAVQAEVDRMLAPLVACLGDDDWTFLAAAEADERPAIKYLAGLTLRGAVLAIDIARRAGQIGVPELRASVMSADLFSSLHLDDDRLDRLLHTEIDLLLAKSSSISWTNLLSHPFVKVGGSLIGLPCLMTQNWTAAVRSEMGTGTTGRNYGALWEREIENLFRAHDWHCVRGTSISASATRPATDADLIATQGDVCVVVQVKAITRSGFNTFENWKARQTILKGADQAITATSKLRDDIHFRISVLGRQRAESIHLIVPLVVTNSIVFSGWEVDGVPVLNVSSLSLILKGGVIHLMRFKDRQKTVAELPRVAIGPAEIAQLLHQPVEWTLATETEAVGHTLSTEFRVHFAIPHLVRPDELTLTEAGVRRPS